MKKMRTLTLLILLLLISINKSSAQFKFWHHPKYEQSLLYVTFCPDKLGYGLMFENTIIKNWYTSFIVSADNGTYHSPNYYNSKVSVAKFGAGFRVYNFAAIAHYNHLYNHTIDEVKGDYFVLDNVHKWSLELGGIGPVSELFDFGILYDVFNKEGRLVLGISLGNNNKLIKTKRKTNHKNKRGY